MCTEKKVHKWHDVGSPIDNVIAGDDEGIVHFDGSVGEVREKQLVPTGLKRKWKVIA